MTPIKTIDDTANRKLELTRLVNAPRELVWKVWTDRNTL
jgi:uncharacterized protein YndB with AHSA1/START domain